MTFKYQEQFAQELYAEFLAGNDTSVRSKIRSLKNKAQSAYIASQVTFLLVNDKGWDAARMFAQFMHPNNQ